MDVKKPSVLIIGVYLLDIPNLVESITNNFNQTLTWHVEQQWVAVGESAISDRLQAVTFRHVRQKQPKFVLLNSLIAELDLSSYEYLIVCDDDINLPKGFLDDYLHLQARYEFALAQPSRSHDSYIDHQFVAQLKGIDARLTNFVEIGPLFSVNRDFIECLLPFDELAPMGWGLDFVWPVLLDKCALRMGIIDRLAVRHALRKPVSNYGYTETNESMKHYLAGRKHLSEKDAFTAIEVYTAGVFPVVSHALTKKIKPKISAIICTYNRRDLIASALKSLCDQTLEKKYFEVIVVDDGSVDLTRKTVESYSSRLPIRYSYQENAGLASARNHGLYLACGEIIVFLDDDDFVDSDFLQQHVSSHQQHPENNMAILGFTDLAEEIKDDPLMHYVTEIGCDLFSYPRLAHGQRLNFSYFWGGRSSCKRLFLLTHGVFNPVFKFGAEDIELSYRLAKEGFQIIYNKFAVSYMNRALSFEDFCRRSYLQGRSNFVFGQLHPDQDVIEWAQLETLIKDWEQIGANYNELLQAGKHLDLFARERFKAGLKLDALAQFFLQKSYKNAFSASRIKGSIDMKKENAQDMT